MPTKLHIPNGSHSTKISLHLVLRFVTHCHPTVLLLRRRNAEGDRWNRAKQLADLTSGEVVPLKLCTP
jgi:hypothetical protein